MLKYVGCHDKVFCPLKTQSSFNIYVFFLSFAFAPLC